MTKAVLAATLGFAACCNNGSILAAGTPLCPSPNESCSTAADCCSGFSCVSGTCSELDSGSTGNRGGSTGNRGTTGSHGGTAGISCSLNGNSCTILPCCGGACLNGVCAFQNGTTAAGDNGGSTGGGVTGGTTGGVTGESSSGGDTTGGGTSGGASTS